MIQERFKDIFINKSVAILGAGPSLKLHSNKEDITIVVNGASSCVERYDIFMAGDVNSPKRDWWIKSLKNENQTRIVSSYIAPFDTMMYPNEEIRNYFQREITKFMLQNNSNPIHYVNFKPSIKPKKPHAFFTFGGMGEDIVEKISPEQDVMYWGGTISAIALQLALISGSKDIHVYGCGFNNGSGNNYSYSCPIGQEGKTTDKQAKIMQMTIDKIRKYGVKIKIHGESVLK
ncbi:MAG: hypothetical protein AB7V77_05560 [Candidatus Woesearchaeota archaeon]